MTIDELIKWRDSNIEAVTRLLHQHREIAGVHYMIDESQQAYVEFDLKWGHGSEELEAELRQIFGDIECRLVLVEEEPEDDEEL